MFVTDRERAMIRPAKRNAAIVLGVTLWFAAAMTVHWLPQLFDGGIGSAAMFALGIPISWASVLGVTRIVQPERHEILPMIAWGLIAATLLDGLGVTFFPALYAGVSSASQFGLGWIIWGVGWFLTFAIRAQQAD